MTIIPEYCASCHRVPCPQCKSHRVGITSHQAVKRDGPKEYNRRVRWLCSTCDTLFYTTEDERRFQAIERQRDKMTSQVYATIRTEQRLGDGLIYLLEGGTLNGVCKLWGILSDEAKYITRHEGLYRNSNGRTERWTLQQGRETSPMLEWFIHEQYLAHVDAERIAYLAELHQVSEIERKGTMNDTTPKREHIHVEVHNAWTISTSNEDGTRAIQSVAQHGRPQDWGDTERWTHIRCTFTWHADDADYTNHFHGWTDATLEEPGMYLELFAQFAAMIAMPGSPPELCGDTHLDEDDIWDDTWGTAPPYADDEEEDLQPGQWEAPSGTIYNVADRWFSDDREPAKDDLAALADNLAQANQELDEQHPDRRRGYLDGIINPRPQETN